MSKVSVIIPVYNAELYLENCIESVLNQTLKDIDIWLINDGSTDESLDICKKYEIIDKRINVVTQKNSGAGKARELGVKLCKGDYVGFVDADDWIDKTMFESMYNVAIKKKVDVVRCNTKLHKNGKIEERWNPPYCNMLLSKQDIEEKIIPLLIAPEKEKNYNQRLLRGCVCAIYKREVIIKNDIHFTNLKSGEDILFALDVMLNANGLWILPDPFYHYMFYNADSLSKSSVSVNKCQRTELRRQMKLRLKDHLGYNVVCERWKQEDRRLVYLDIRIICVYSEINKRNERIALLNNILREEDTINAFKDPIDKTLPFQMYVLYFLIKHKQALLLDYVVRMKFKRG